MKINILTLSWTILVVLAFTIGLWGGYVLHQEHMFKGMVMVAEGLEGTTFNIEVAINETLLVKAVHKNLEQYGIFNFTNKSSHDENV